MSKKARDARVDLIRIIAACIVIGVHTNKLILTSVDKSRILWKILLSDGVTFFFIIMGFFLFKNKSFIMLLKRTIKGILVPGVIIIFLTELLFPWISNQCSFGECFQIININYAECFKYIFNWTGNGAWGHIWYIFTYLQIILLFPVLRMIIKDKKCCKYVIIFCFFNLLINDLQNYFNTEINIQPFYLFMPAVMMVLIGYEIYLKKDIIYGNILIRISAILIAFLTQSIRYYMQINLYNQDLNKNDLCFWETTFSVVFATAIIIFILSFKISNVKLQECLSYVGSRTFVIYLIHPLVFYYLDSRGFTEWIFGLINKETNLEQELTMWNEFVYISLRICIVFIISLVGAIIIHSAYMMIKKTIGIYKK